MSADTKPPSSGASISDELRDEFQRTRAPRKDATPKANGNSKQKQIAYAATEDDAATIFVTEYGHILRFCHDTGRWFQWDGYLWRPDRKAFAYHLCRKINRDVGGGSKEFGKASRAAGVERFARSDPAVAVNSDIWDKDPYLLGTPKGTVNLRTGELGPANQKDFITKSTSVAPVAGDHIPLWLNFLSQATCDNAEFIRLLQQWCGYCLTGDVSEHALLFLFGPGGNGKGVFLNTVTRILGDYAVIAAMETFTASKFDRHPTELAMLRGARLVSVSETEEGRAWAENRIKSLTGGDPITAHFMHKDNFTYLPQFKLTIIGNHKPILRNVDDAICRRFNLAPFTFKPPVVDRSLAEKLVPEYPGILRWMIKGCLDWQSHGLVRPEVVKAATVEYFVDQNTIQHWVEDNCEVGPKCSDTFKSLFASWRNYATDQGDIAGSSKGFSEKLQALEFAPIKNTHGIRGRGFAGVKVRVSEPPPPGYGDR